MKTKKNQFRCVMCDKLKTEKSDFFIPFLIEGDIAGGKVCTSCYCDNLFTVAAFNSKKYLPKAKKKSKRKASN